MKSPALTSLVALAATLTAQSCLAGSQASTASSAKQGYTRNVAIVVYDNAQPLDWTGPYEVYNDAARAYNTTAKRFPTLITARIFGFEERPYFEAPAEAKEAPKVEF